MTRQTTFNIIFVIISVILSIIVGVKQNTINDLNVAILESKNAPPKTIIVTDTKIEYVYKDNEKVTIKKSPEAKVTLDTGRYESLNREIARLENELATVANDTTYADKYTTKTDSIKIEIEKIKYVLKTPLQSGIINIQQFGFTNRINAGIVFDGEVAPVLSYKWLYFHEYGLSFAATPNVGGIALSRYLYDVPYLGFLKNTQAALGIGMNYKTAGTKVFTGLMVNL
jgi:hypothetical protein